jgi:glutathione peroxidase
MSSIYDFTVSTAKGESTALSDYRGKVLLIVNTASECGYTPQYAGLEQLHKTYFERGLRVLGFPCNQFGGQEPGDDKEIQRFCELKFHTTFPIFAKVEVNGEHSDPLFKYLRQQLPGLLGTEAIKWNFTKFLIDRNGKPLKRYAPKDSPESLSGDIEMALAS